MKTQRNYNQYLRLSTNAASKGVDLTVEQRQQLQRQVDNLANALDPLTQTVHERRAVGGLTLKRLAR